VTDTLAQFEDNEVGYVTGRVTSHVSSTIPTLEAVAARPSEEAESEAPLTGRMLGSRPLVSLPHSTMIGELKLTALKARLASIGVQAELIGEGVLICGGGAKKNAGSDTLEESVAVRKTARGKVELEGNVSDVYYKVRREIYNLHALVAAA
jgi:cleavage and polyadenylation specificity factor subunit 2